MSILKVVPFNEDGTMGDSLFNPSIAFDYHNEMKLKELQTLTNAYFMKEWGYETVEEYLAECPDNEVVGGWVILDDYLKIINVVVTVGSDSACYAVNHTMKEQVKKASNLLVD